jgi:hypothetical protein
VIYSGASAACKDILYPTYARLLQRIGAWATVA